jgi:NodT family efflux transporter outer membrane factor (OMF) lipoprotein
MTASRTKQTRRLTALCLTALLVIGGCAVGPDYQEPEIVTPDVWHQDLVRGLSGGQASLDTWWTVLEDPALIGLIERAGQGSLELRQAFERIAEAMARRGIAVGEWFPSVDSDTLYERSQISEELDLGLPIGGRPNDLYSTGLATTWEVDLFGRIRRSVESADAELAASVEDYRDVRVVLYAEVAANYIDVRTLQHRILSAERNVAAQKDTLELVRVRNRVGLVGELDLRQAELNVSRTASTIPALREALAAAVNRTAVLLGEYPSQLHAELRDTVPIPRPEAEVAVGLPAELLRQRPDLRAAERQLAAQSARIGVATADLYPRLALLGSFSFDAASTASWFTSGAQAWNIGPQLRWNLFDGGRIRSNVRAQEALTRQALARYEQTVLLAVEEVENSLAGYAEERARAEELGRGVRAAEQTVELVQVLYRTGLVDFLNVLDAERSLFEAQDQLLESEGRIAKNLVRVYRALGGGWTP